MAIKIFFRFLHGAAKWFLLTIFLVFLPILLSGLQVSSHFNDKSEEKAECGVIFGAAVWRDDKPSNALDDRIQKGAELYKNGQVTCLILSGGASTYGSHEVDVMEKELLEEAIPENVLKKDYEGNSTIETIENLPNDVQSFVFISQDFHLGRIMLMAEEKYNNTDVKLAAHGASYQYGRFPRQSYYLMREVAGIIYFYVSEVLF